MYENILCIIPARAGSKGIPNKNMQRLSGVPLFVYSVREAKEAGIPIENIVVTSDSKEILRLAKDWEVLTHDRPPELATDEATTESALLSVIEYMKPREFDTILLLQPTSPLRFKNRIAHAIKTYQNGDYDSLVSVTKFPNLFWKHDGVPIFTHRKRKQEFTPDDYFYFDNGNLYLSNTQMLISTNCRTGNKVCLYEISEIEGMQIDTQLEMNVFDKIIATGLLRFTDGTM